GRTIRPGDRGGARRGPAGRCGAHHADHPRQGAARDPSGQDGDRPGSRHRSAHRAAAGEARADAAVHDRRQGRGHRRVPREEGTGLRGEVRTRAPEQRATVSLRVQGLNPATAMTETHRRLFPEPSEAIDVRARPVPCRAGPERTLQPQDKSFPVDLVGQPITALEAPLSAFSTPLLLLDDKAISHNLEVMARWTAQRGLELMPHGKTTMAPVLWRRQLAAGCTGITVATGWQADLALREGVATVKLANTCTDPALLRRLAAHLAEHPEQELVCWVDGLATIDLLER